MNQKAKNKNQTSQNFNVWHKFANVLTFVFLFLAFSPIGLDIISLITYTLDSPLIEQKMKKDAKKAIFTIYLLGIMHLINFIICYRAAQDDSNEEDQAKSTKLARILNYLNQFLSDQANLVKTQCYFFGACITMIIALSFRFQIMGKYQQTDNINRILQFHLITLITTCGFYLLLLSLIFSLNIYQLQQSKNLGIKSIVYSFLFIYTCGMIDLGTRNQFSLSEQLLETQESSENEQSKRQSEDIILKFEQELKVIV